MRSEDKWNFSTKIIIHTLYMYMSINRTLLASPKAICMCILSMAKQDTRTFMTILGVHCTIIACDLICVIYMYMYMYRYICNLYSSRVKVCGNIYMYVYCILN